MSPCSSRATTFAGYRIESLIGRGGMGVVYRATDLSLERPVALKLIAPEYAEDARFRKRFLKEPRLAAALDHPNVVPIYEAREHDGQLYLAMRYVPGEDLRTRLARATAARRRDGAAHARAGRRRARRRPPPRPRAPRRQAGEHPARRGRPRLPDRLRDQQAAELGHRPATGRWSGRSTTWRRSGSAASTSTAAATSTRSRACSTSAWPARRRSGARPRRRRCGRTCRASIPPVPGHPTSTRCSRRRLAKDPTDRYATCSELVEDAARCCSAGDPGVRSPRVRRGCCVGAGDPRRRRCWSRSRRGAILRVRREENESAARSPSATASPRSPARRRGGGADPSPDGAEQRRRRRGRRLGPEHATRGGHPHRPEDQARERQVQAPAAPDRHRRRRRRRMGRQRRRAQGEHTVSISRVDPKTRKVTRTVEAARRSGETVRATLNWGSPTSSVGAGAVWAHQPGQHDLASRPGDGQAGRRTSTCEATNSRRSRARCGSSRATRPYPINPRTNEPAPDDRDRQPGAGRDRRRRRGRSGSSSSKGRCGASTRTATRRPGRSTSAPAHLRRLRRRSGLDRQLRRRHDLPRRPATNAVTERVRIGAAQALAAGAGSAWVSTAGATAAGTLPEAVCAPLESGGRRPTC